MIKNILAIMFSAAVALFIWLTLLGWGLPDSLSFIVGLILFVKILRGVLNTGIGKC